MIPEATLRHTATIERLSMNGKDKYNNPINAVSAQTFKCYFDGQVEELTFFYEKQNLRAEAVLFVHPSVKFTIGDIITSVKDVDGNDIINNVYYIGHIMPAADLNRMHHNELYLVTALK